MTKRALLFLAAVLVSLHSSALDLGVVAGSVGRPSSFLYGLSLGSGTFVPLVKLEFEGTRTSETGWNSLSAAVKVRPKFGRLAPYALLGAGGEFAKLSFRFSEYDFYTFVGGGLHLFFAPIISLRADARFLHFSGLNRTRISGGVFIHL
ncbi:MAG: hypothetical protein JXO51_12390 [Candidatus Aminicenantes bacterium]|nr:hypothetical protein [Candidatus Aminicenantes bacterium]